MDLLVEIDHFKLTYQDIGVNETGEYSLVGKFLRGPYHYGKSLLVIVLLHQLNYKLQQLEAFTLPSSRSSYPDI